MGSPDLAAVWLTLKLASVVTLLLLAIVFGSFIRHLSRMLYGAPPADVADGERATWRTGLLLLSVVVLVTLGLTLPAPLATLLNQSVTLIGR